MEAGDGASLVSDNKATVEAMVGVGLYIFEATCNRKGGPSESSFVVIDTRPSGVPELPPFAMWDPPFEEPVCLTCPYWIASLDESIFDIRQQGIIRTDVDFASFGAYAAQLGMHAGPAPKLPQGVELSFGALDTVTSTSQGEELAQGLTLTGYTYDGFERITARALTFRESGIVIGAFLLEAMGDPSPQPN